MSDSPVIPLPPSWPSPAERSIRVVGPNPAMDRLQVISELYPGSVHRATRVIERAGGKSFIVARTLRRLGVDVTMFGFLGGPVGALMVSECAALGIVDCHTQIRGSSRITPVLIEEGSGRSTVINEPGPMIDPGELERLLERVRNDVAVDDIVVCTGSLPRGVPQNLYAEIVSLADRAGAFTVVDASGEALRSALTAAPWVVKCNAVEFAWAQRCSPSDDQALMSGMRRQIELGTSAVIVTRGRDTTLLSTADGVWQVSVPEVETVNATGSGDTFLGCFVAAVSNGLSLPRALCDATVGGALNAGSLEAGLPEGADLGSLRANILVRAFMEVPR